MSKTAHTRSRWRQEARAIIASVIASLPPRTSFRDACKAIDAAYPWGDVSWPKKKWCQEAAEAKRELERKSWVGWNLGQEVAINLGKAVAVLGFIRSARELTGPDFCVVCTHCDDARQIRVPLKGGCLLCAPLRARWEATWAGRDLWEAVRRAIEDEEGVEAVMLEGFLGDHDWPDVAEWVRDHWPPATKHKRKRKKRRQ